MIIHSFDDLVAIDEELAGLFLRPDQAVSWVYAVENGIKEWIGKHNKQYWEIVRFVSQERGVLGKLRRDGKTVKLKREDFARVLLKFCPEAFAEGESVSALKSSMEHYEFTDKLRDLNRTLSGHLVRHHIKAVEDILDGNPVVEPHENAYKPTLEDLVVTYLRREVDERANQFPRSKICIRPHYDGISPAISVETYKSEQFLKERRPSSIEAYEVVDGVLQKSKFYELAGQYADKRVKLYIVSSAGLLPDVRAMAADRNIGYVLLNPNAVMTSDGYVLPRSIEDYTKMRHDLDVLEGTRPMTTPLLIWDGSRLTSSLTDVLSENGVAVKNQRLLYIPFVPEEEIEQRANALTAADVERITKELQRSTMLDAEFSLDPFAYADSCGLSHDEVPMEADYQLGRMDVEKSHVTLNSAGSVNANRFRFTMAHELGHFLLHAPLFRKQGVVSVGESEDTLSISKSNSRRLEYQANKFASCLLMPKDLVVPLYAYFFNQYVSQRFGDGFHALYYNPKQPETWSSYNSIVGNMANLFGVSLSALRIRLLSLRLLKMPD
ncbi:MAG: ImmA/IrrE family metallo-endopeptidase [Bacteroidaceae bacterium]|nr:ImmA/IrrE family metallo-endopeptidase [Bacteroidaceae bacterium]